MDLENHLRDFDRRVAGMDENPQKEGTLMPVALPAVRDVELRFEITLIDETKLIGIIGQVTAETVVLTTEAGLHIEVSDSMIDGVRWLEGRFLRRDPNQTRLFLAPTGRSLKVGKGYFADYILFFPTVAVGLTDFFALSGGVSMFPVAEEQVVYVAPKIGLVQSRDVHLAAGLLYLSVPDSDNLGVVYSVATIGSSTGGVTTGIGYGFEEDEWADSPMILIGGEIQVSDIAKLLTENWIFTSEDDFVMFSGGIRFFGESLAVDFGLITWNELLSDGGFPFVPWIDFAVNW